MKTSTAKLFYVIWAIVSVVYVYLTFTAPVASNHYNLSASQIHLLDLTIIIPIVLIWLAVTYGAVRLKSYARTILSSSSSSKDGVAMNKIANGVMVLAIALYESGLGGSYRQLNSSHYIGITIIQNYIQLGLILLAFYLIFRGSSVLVEIAKASGRQLKGLQIGALPLVILAGSYGWLLHAEPFRNTTPDPTLHASFYLSDGWIWLTIMIPYLLVWTFGAFAAINIRVYMREIKGEIYRSSLSNLGNGIFVVIVLSIISQLLGSLDFSGFGLAPILLLVYVLVLLIAVGYILIALGARQLSKIETVQ